MILCQQQRHKNSDINKTVHGSKKEAEKELARFYIECEDGKISKASTMSIEQLADTYLVEYVDRHLKVSTRRGFDTAIKVWIKPLLGKKKVSKLTRLDIQQWINHIAEAREEKRKDGSITKRQLSPKTIRNHYSVLCGMMYFAIDMDIIEDTPCKISVYQKKSIKKWNTTIWTK